MTAGGWVLMGLSVGGVVCFLSWCLYKVFTTAGDEKRIHSQADIDPHDQEK
jgi:hypothetical protein